MMREKYLIGNYTADQLKAKKEELVRSREAFLKECGWVNGKRVIHDVSEMRSVWRANKSFM